MELVRGVPITEYCDEHQLTPRRRLELFVPVCHAVQHAHQKGIIHRDLKPSNVLVAEYDEQAVAKIIDFGVAKAVGQQLTDKTMFTQVGQLVGTIDYMSPEQAKLNQLDVDTRTDIYSLGVLLYELLTGETPFDHERLHAAALDEMLRIIREEDPPRPSTRLSSSSSSTLPSAAAKRRTEPKRLATLVRGELDWIVMRCLEKDRTRRYESANGLGMDIQRYLADEQVLACPPSAAYRFSKFARRNRAALLTVAIVSVALVVGTVVSLWQAVRATRAEHLADQRLSAETHARAAEAEQRKAAEAQRREAENQRELAEGNYQKAKAAVDRYFTLVSETTLLDVPGLQPLRKQLLEAAGQFYEEALQKRTDDPVAMANLAAAQLRLSQIYFIVDQFDDNGAAIHKALAIIDRLRRDYAGAAEHLPKVAGFWSGLRWVRTMPAESRDPKSVAQAWLRLEETWSELAQQFPSEPKFQRDLAAIRSLIASSKKDRELQRNAHSVAEKLVQKFPRVLEYREDLTQSYLLLAEYTSSGTEYSGSSTEEHWELHRQAIALAEELVAEVPNSARYRTMLAEALAALGGTTVWCDPQGSELMLRRSTVLYEALISEFPNDAGLRDKYVETTVDWVRCPSVKINDAVATERIRRAEAYLEAYLKDRPKDRFFRQLMAFLCHTRAEKSLRQENDLAAAEPLQRRALALFIELAHEFPHRAQYSEYVDWSFRNLGEVYLRAGKPDQTLAVARQNVDTWQILTEMNPANPLYRRRLASALGFLIERLVTTGQAAEADCERQREIRIWEAFLTENPQGRAARQQLAWALSEAADKSVANRGLRESILQRALSLHAELTAEIPGDFAHSEQIAHLQRHLGWLEWGKGQLEDARKHFEKGADVFAKLAADKIPQRDGFYRSYHADTLKQLASVLADQGNAEEAVATAQRCVDVYQSLVSESPNNFDHCRAMASAEIGLARQLIAIGQSDEAEARLRKLISVVPQQLDAFASLAALLARQSRVEEAKAAILAASQQDSTDALAINNVAWFLATTVTQELRDPALAVTLAQKAVDLEPKSTQYLNTLGTAQYRGGKWPESIASLAKAEELAPGQTLAYNGFFLAMAHWQLGHQDEARKWHERSVEWMAKNQPTNKELVRFRAEAEELLGLVPPGDPPKAGPQSDTTKPPG
jgi:tetratricopeptide (TPR) repeat protein